jgi:hypothetical protein
MWINHNDSDPRSKFTGSGPDPRAIFWAKHQNNYDTLSNLSSDFSAQFVAKKQSGNALCMRLKAENDEGAIQRHASTFDYGNYKVFESLLASMNSFEYLLTANDDGLEAAYREYFEPQTSKYYL